MKTKFRVLIYITSIFLCLLIGYISGIKTKDSIDEWYSFLIKPSFNPPNWIFGPVWTFLYILMGISIGRFIIHTPRSLIKTVVIVLFISQLALNGWWSILFFGNKRPDFAFYEIIGLWLIILAYIIVTYRISKTSSILMIPYILWISFAAILNYSIWQMNS